MLSYFQLLGTFSCFKILIFTYKISSPNCFFGTSKIWLGLEREIKQWWWIAHGPKASFGNTEHYQHHKTLNIINTTKHWTLSTPQKAHQFKKYQPKKNWNVTTNKYQNVYTQIVSSCVNKKWWICIINDNK